MFVFIGRKKDRAVKTLSCGILSCYYFDWTRFLLTTKITVKAPAETMNTIRIATGNLSPVVGTSLSEESEGLEGLDSSVEDGFVRSVPVPVAGITVTSFTASQF